MALGLTPGYVGQEKDSAIARSMSDVIVLGVKGTAVKY